MSKQDSVCPKPTSVAKRTPSTYKPSEQSRLQSALSGNSEETSMVNDEGQVCASRQRKRSELTLLYSCPICNKKYNSSQAVYSHKWLNHKDPAASSTSVVQ